MVDLPIPDTSAIAHSQAVCADLYERYAQQTLSFAEYMQHVLYAPGLGYYVAGQQRFGPGGDFTTAPEISCLFGQCLARQCASILAQLGAKACIMEYGAGSGQLAFDLLQQLIELDTLPNTYYILELSPDLRARQQQLLAPLAQHVDIQWLSTQPSEPLHAIVLANEVLDAMPVQRFCLDANTIYECCVEISTNSLKEIKHSPISPDLVEKVQALELPMDLHGYTSEINLALPAWIHSVAQSIQCGIVFLIDYGFPRHEYYHPQRAQGTLMCHYQHHAHSDPFFYPGLQDITAHVDFTAVAEAAQAAGFSVKGYTTQALFLLANGLADLEPLPDNKQQIQRSHAINLLTSPSEMGELFKVMALAKSYDHDLQHFSLRDMRDRL